MAAIGLRLLMYWQNRSLFIDEACVSYQLLERDFAGLFDNLQYQYAPPLFLVGVKWVTQIFGANEYALRLLPLLAALVSLPLFYRLLKRFVQEPFVVLPIFLFGFGMPILQYATEVKQYSMDVLITISLLLLATAPSFGTKTTKGLLFWSLIGGSVVWLSMPSVFILFGIGLSWWYRSWMDKDWRQVWRTGAVILTWLCSFALYYFSIIRKDIGLEGLENYHSRFFLPLPPTNWEELHQFYELIITFYRTAIGPTVVAIAFGLLATFLGGYHLRVKKKTPELLILSLPIFAAMLASVFNLYSLIPRLTLFLMPLFLILIAIGQAWLLKRSALILKYAWIAVICIICINQKGYAYFWQTFQIEELRVVLQEMKQAWRPGDTAYLHAQGTHAYTFYSQYHEDAASMAIPEIRIGHWSDRPATLDLPQSDRLWLVFSHVEASEVNTYLQEVSKERTIKMKITAKGASAILLEKSKF